MDKIVLKKLIVAQQVMKFIVFKRNRLFIAVITWIPSLDCALSQENSTHSLTTCVFKIHFPL